MSSEWAPRHRMRSGAPPPTLRPRLCITTVVRSAADRGERFVGRRLVPDLPGRAAAAIRVFELLAILERVHRRPEPVVLVRDQPALEDQALERLADELFAVAEILENL